MGEGHEKYTFFDTASCYKELLFHISFFTYISVYTHIYKYCWCGCRDRCSHRYTEKKRSIEISLQMLLLFSHSVVSDSFVTCMDCSPSCSSVHGILQAKGLEWTAIPFSRGSSQSRDWTCDPCFGRQILYHQATREAQLADDTYLNVNRGWEVFHTCPTFITF